MSDIKPCPSCRNGAEVRINDYTPTTKIRVECNMCWLRTNDYPFPKTTYTEVINIWNDMVNYHE